MKIKIKQKFKALDGMINVKFLSKDYQELLHKHGINYNYISTNNSRHGSAVIQELFHDKVPLSYDEIIARFKEEKDEVFQYLSTLNSWDIWVEINRNPISSNNHPVSAHETAQKYNLGLYRFSHHHVANYNSERRYENYIDNQYIEYIYFYYSLDRLVEDIRKKVENYE